MGGKKICRGNMDFCSVLFFGCAGSSLLCGLFLVVVKGASHRCGGWASHCGDFSHCRPRALSVRVSVVAGLKLQ